MANDEFYTTVARTRNPEEPADEAGRLSAQG
jgi:hypothetical protein